MEHMDIKLDHWKKNLLDLGKRNRLINCPLPPENTKRVQRHTLLLKKPTSNEIWDLLVEANDVLIFPMLPYEGDTDDEIIHGLGEVESNVKTNQSKKETYKTLRALKTRSREFNLEKGINSLHLAFGFLNWKDNGVEGENVRSPLLLLPVHLSQEDVFAPFVLSCTEDEIVTNHSLEEKLRGDFGINLPTFSEDMGLKEYLIAVEESIGMGWTVSNDVCQLSLFSFMKINMYHDLEANAERIKNHVLIRLLSGEDIDDESVNMMDMNVDYNHDNTEPRDVFSVVDADSSQQDAIRSANAGKSFVLQGPPGTGKSQTITNIIAELIAKGKKVLFVSEKVSALEVVNNRLKLVGLDPFCLSLHSHSSKRRDILDQLNATINLSRQKVTIQQEAFDDLRKLKEIRASLNQYNEDLHTVVEPLGLTIHQIQGNISKYGKYPNVDYIQKNADQFNRDLLGKSKDALEELTRIVKIDGYQVNNPWQGYDSSQQLTQEFIQRFAVDADSLISLVNTGINLFSQINEIFENSYGWSYISIDDIEKILEISDLSPTIPQPWLSLDFEKVNTLLISAINARELSEQCRILKVSCQNSKEELDNCKDVYDVLLVKRSNIVSEMLPNTGRTDDLPSSILLINETANFLKTVFESENKKLESLIGLHEDEKSKMNKETDILSNDYDESIFQIDASELRGLYRTEYRSKIKRIGSNFKQSQNKLIAHRKSSGKLSYEAALADLELIIKIQDMKHVIEMKENDILKSKSEFEKHKNEHLNYQIKLSNLKEITHELEQQEKILITSTNEYSAVFDDYNEKNEKLKNLEFDILISKLSTELDIPLAQNSDFLDLKKRIEWAIIFKGLATSFQLGDKYTTAICSADKDILKRLRDSIELIKNWKGSTVSEYEKYTSLFDENHKLRLQKMSLHSFNDLLSQRKNAIFQLEYLIDYRIAEGRISELGLSAYLEKAKDMQMEAEKIIPVFEKCFYRSLLDSLLPKFETIREFRRLRQDERIEMFKTLDKQHLNISRAMLKAKLIGRLPNMDTFSNDGEISLLRREMAKQRKLMPTRLLIAKLPNLLPALKPCIMMSPLSVSKFLGSSNYEFDTVIFDEASQVRTEDAIGAIFRAKQVIIAGDSKQLPPTNFFNASTSSDDEYNEDEDESMNTAGAYESLLDESGLLPTMTLQWHYRSRHEHLIAFSNAKIYNNRLITFPSSSEKIEGMGVEYVHVADGVYDRGGRNGNPIEAEKVADMIFEHFKNYRDSKSLGVIAFSEVQQTAIHDALLSKRKTMPIYEQFFKEDMEEYFFIKNLETVQGDERDTIIFSIGFAPDNTGKFLMNFGPVSRVGGERRLNVAVTRARYNLKLVGSIMPTDIAVERIGGIGPKLLRQYIDFARNGMSAILAETTEEEHTLFDSPFEESVFDFLTNQGFDVKTQVGCSGYRIDMAVKHPQFSGRYAIGIECDGYMYHSARTARERDRLRQDILEDMGWKIHRIWSTDWIKDPYSEGRRLIDAVTKAIESYDENSPFTRNLLEEIEKSDFLEMSEHSVEESIQMGMQERTELLKSALYGYQVEDIPLFDICKVMTDVLSMDYGLTKSGLFKEAALYGYGWKRQGSRIREKFEKAFKKSLRDGVIVEVDEKIILRPNI